MLVVIVVLVMCIVGHELLLVSCLVCLLLLFLSCVIGGHVLRFVIHWLSCVGVCHVMVAMCRRWLLGVVWHLMQSFGVVVSGGVVKQLLLSFAVVQHWVLFRMRCCLSFVVVVCCCLRFAVVCHVSSSCLMCVACVVLVVGHVFVL